VPRFFNGLQLFLVQETSLFSVAIGRAWSDLDVHFLLLVVVVLP